MVIFWVTSSKTCIIESFASPPITLTLLWSYTDIRLILLRTHWTRKLCYLDTNAFTFKIDLIRTVATGSLRSNCLRQSDPLTFYWHKYSQFRLIHICMVLIFNQQIIETHHSHRHWIIAFVLGHSVVTRWEPILLAMFQIRIKTFEQPTEAVYIVSILRKRRKNTDNLLEEINEQLTSGSFCTSCTQTVLCYFCNNKFAFTHRNEALVTRIVSKQSFRVSVDEERMGRWMLGRYCRNEMKRMRNK